MVTASRSLGAVICEDDPVVRAALVDTINGLYGIEIRATLTSGAETVAAAAGARPDLVVVDLALAGVWGLRIVPRLIEVAPGSMVVAVVPAPFGSLRAEAETAGAAALIELSDLRPLRGAASTSCTPASTPTPAARAAPPPPAPPPPSPSPGWGSARAGRCHRAATQDRAADRPRPIRGAADDRSHPGRGQAEGGDPGGRGHEAIRRSLGIGLKRAGYAVRAEPDGRALLEVVRDFRPDLAILDVRLPVGPVAFTMARQLRSDDALPILFLTAAEGLRDRLEGFEAGADDYSVKPYELDELLARVRALPRRSGRERDPVWRAGDLVVDSAARTAVRGGTELDLTRTEFELLAALLQHPGQVLSKQQLLSQVWGSDARDRNLVEVHLSSLRRKLESCGPRVVHTVRSVGYVLRP